MLAFLDRFRYIFLAVVLAAGLLAEATEIVMANTPKPIVVAPRDMNLPTIAEIIARISSVESSEAESLPKKAAPLPLFAHLVTKQYRAVPVEDLNPIEWVDPWQTKEKQVVRWLPIIENVLASGDYPNVDAMLVMGIIAQETGGDPNAECNDFDAGRGTCATGVMAIAAESWTGTAAQLSNPTYNIATGIRIINTVYDQALEHGFRPGREATRAALAAYNCGWKSLLADKCYSFGGFAYADKVTNYWMPLLEDYLQGEQSK